jgi:Flp pilus assembly protein protease CpaA
MDKDNKFLLSLFTLWIVLTVVFGSIWARILWNHENLWWYGFPILGFVLFFFIFVVEGGGDCEL